jgi:hypothetical protein
VLVVVLAVEDQLNLDQVAAGELITGLERDPLVMLDAADQPEEVGVEAAAGDGNYDLTAHDLAFVMGVGVVFAAAVLHVSAAMQLH